MLTLKTHAEKQIIFVFRLKFHLELILLPPMLHLREAQNVLLLKYLHFNDIAL
jgi:hypothetical protein